ncbi:Subtilisin protease SBT4.14 [Spatholobus suberectus]|nr:Subtilisin protease SBT4.14 [Spatholobus suberectus]
MLLLNMFLQKQTKSFSLVWLQLLLILPSSSSVNGNEQKNFYIVFLGAHTESRGNALETYLNVLSAVKGSYPEAKESMVYSYTKSFNAFAAKLSEDEANKLSAMDEVLLVFRNQYRQLHTTRSWNFIGLPPTAKRRLKLESDIVVALFDTGITPESKSFKDDGFGPPPARWKGSCGHFANFSGCNKKIIGAKYFKADGNPDPSDILSPVDVDGHGTHTASTAAGNLVPNASLFGLANGTARGAVPSARLAIYKVCWSTSGCADMDILAAFDAAIHDGVDVISISIGGGDPNYVEDGISVGAFHAMRKGIITVASAGNGGPTMGTVTNTAPWIVTVAASGIDRAFKSTVQLGNGNNVSGVGVSCFNPKQKQYPLVRGIDAAKDSKDKDSARFCYEDSLEPKKVKGKLVYCKLGTWGTEAVVKGIGGIGTLIESDQYPDVAQIFMAPATIVNSGIGDTITKYIQSTRSPSAVIYKSHGMQIQAPFVATFSSRGPNPGSQNVLKPDVAAPGIDILASYTLKKSLTGLKGDTQFSEFILLSGTSMACPHVAGVAAYVKSFHPNWTPAAIRSAIITTAKPMSKRVNNEAEFAYGSGQLNPTRAVSPGLVYDMDDFGYIQFLCHEGYNGSSLSALVGSPVNCSSLLPGLGHDAINYPTMQLSLESNKGTRVGVFRRTVTNVGPASTIYNATITSPKGVEITVKPTSLIFSKTLQKRSFKVVVKATSIGRKKIVSGSLIWRSPRYVVRSPIVINNA